ncbi:MAG: aquaporin [Anaerolineae bacterium]|nr:aquaporin [Anaerolineae bacterium]
MNQQHGLWQRCLAELIGTFAVVFAACGSVIADAATSNGVGLLGIALAPGLMVMAMIYALGPISGAHFNPAVTLAFAATRRFTWRHVPEYLLSQFSGAVLAVLALNFFHTPAHLSKVQFAAHIPQASFGAALGIEILLTFFLMFVIVAVATDPRVPASVTGLAIGLTVSVCILLGAAVSGASMNPFRSLAPALFAGGAALTAFPIYAVGPIIGALLAAFVYEQLRQK